MDDVSFPIRPQTANREAVSPSRASTATPFAALSRRAIIGSHGYTEAAKRRDDGYDGHRRRGEGRGGRKGLPYLLGFNASYSFHPLVCFDCAYYIHAAAKNPFPSSRKLHHSLHTSKKFE